MGTTIGLIKRIPMFLELLDLFGAYEDLQGVRITRDTVIMNKVQTSYKLEALIKITPEDIISMEHEQIDFGIISVSKFLKTMRLFSTTDDLHYSIIRTDAGLLKMFIFSDKKIATFPLSEIIKVSDQYIKKDQPFVFEMEIDNDLKRFISESRKIINNQVLYLAFDKDRKVSLIAGDIHDVTEYSFIYDASSFLTANFIQDNYDALRQSPTSKAFTSTENYDLCIKYNMQHVAEMMNVANRLKLLTNGGLLLYTKENEYEVYGGFVPLL